MTIPPGARVSGWLFGYSPAEWWTMFGLTVPQAAATLAAALIGVQIGLFDDAVLNETILTILVTCILGPWVVERFGRRLALEEERRPYEPGAAPQRVLVPMANPATADALMGFALAIREPASREPVYPLTVVPDRTRQHVAVARLGHPLNTTRRWCTSFSALVDVFQEAALRAWKTLGLFLRRSFRPGEAVRTRSGRSGRRCLARGTARANIATQA